MSGVSTPSRAGSEVAAATGPRAAVLLGQHQRLIAASAISHDVAAERGYWSATQPKQLERWFGDS